MLLQTFGLLKGEFGQLLMNLPNEHGVSLSEPTCGLPTVCYILPFTKIILTSKANR